MDINVIDVSGTIFIMLHQPILSRQAGKVCCGLCQPRDLNWNFPGSRKRTFSAVVPVLWNSPHPWKVKWVLWPSEKL